MQRQPWTMTLGTMALAMLWTFSAIRPADAAAVDPACCQPIRKLSRGLANTVTGVLEIPLTIATVGQEEGPVAGLSWGLLLGFGAAVTRTIVGVAETLTFPFPLPRSSYEPLLQPEFLLRPDVNRHSSS